MVPWKDPLSASKLDNQYAVIIGGVDGEKRSSEISLGKSRSRVCADRWTISAFALRQTGFRSARQSNLTEHDTALGCIPVASPRWEALHVLCRIILPTASDEDAGTILSSAGLLVLQPPAPARFLSQRLNLAWIN